MGRIFNVPHPKRSLEIRVTSVDEAWEFWLCERGRQLTMGGVLSIDAATEIWREGKDPILIMVERIRAAVSRGEIGLPDEDVPSVARRTG
jgi:hypothetical protein